MLFWAGQLTFEEKYIKKHNISPVHVLGIEGIFSLTQTTALLVIFYFVHVPFDMGQHRGVLEDAIDGFVQLGNNPALLGCYIGKYLLVNNG